MNLALLMPEWIVLGILIVLTVFELLLVDNEILYKRVRNIILFGGLASVALALIATSGQTGSVFNGTVIVDPFGTFFKLLFTGALAAVIQMSRSFFKMGPEKTHEFYLVLWIALAGFFLLVSSNDFLVFFLALETVTLSFYILTAYLKKDSKSIESGMKYFILGSLASAILVYGISLIYTVAGSTAFPEVRQAFTAAPQHAVLIAAACMVLAGLFFKVAAFPFQLWVPDVYEGAPSPVVAFLSVASKSAGFAALLRILWTVFPVLENQWLPVLPVIALLTLLYGNFGALVQTRLKRLMGYSSIGHAGYLLLALSVGGKAGLAALLYYLAAYAVTTLALFGVICAAEPYLKSDKIEAYRGLGKRSPFLAGVMFLALLSSAGVPPLAGFSGKFLVLLAAVQANLNWLAFIGVMAVALSLYYYLNLVRVMYFDESPREDSIPVCPATRALLTLLSAGILAAGLFLAPVLSWAENAVKYLF